MVFVLLGRLSRTHLTMTNSRVWHFSFRVLSRIFERHAVSLTNQLCLNRRVGKLSLFREAEQYRREQVVSNNVNVPCVCTDRAGGGGGLAMRFINVVLTRPVSVGLRYVDRRPHRAEFRVISFSLRSTRFCSRYTLNLLCN